MSSSKNHPEELVDHLNQVQSLRGKVYRGRFAPSPTGPLHLGNLRTALISWLRARLNRGEWLLRIDDLDTPRNRPGSIENIQSDLLWIGLDWDGPMILQSERRAIYEHVLATLKVHGKVYPCRCSRSVLAKFHTSQSQNFIYPGTCRSLGLPWNLYKGRLPSLRLIVPKEFSSKCGDVVLRRADGYIAYHFATAVDELFLGITEVVRGNDLAKARYSQLAIIDSLDQKPLSYLHVPLFLNKDGTKLSKRENGIGLKSLQLNGMCSEDVIGFLASSLGLVPNGSKLSASELLSDLSKSQKLIENLLFA